jgi:hypothetical protein
MLHKNLKVDTFLKIFFDKDNFLGSLGAFTAGVTAKFNSLDMMSTLAILGAGALWTLKMIQAYYAIQNEKKKLNDNQ